MSPKPDDLQHFGRFTEPAVLILISVADTARHGYAILRDIEVLTGHRPGPGTLYGALGRLESRGFIRPANGSQGNRTAYELTPAGREALRARLAAMTEVARTGLRRLEDA